MDLRDRPAAGPRRRSPVMMAVLIVACVSVACAGRGRPPQRPAQPDRPNVLFIAVDDLRPEGGPFGPSRVRTPHLDELARRGITFTRAYAQQALCSPSRTSLLTGLRPDATRIYDLQTHFRATVPTVVTLPEHFKRNGYHTRSFGKIYHDGLDDPQSWSVPHWMPAVPWNEAYGKPETLADVRRQRERLQAEGKPLGPAVVEREPRSGAALKLSTGGPFVRGPSWEDPAVADDALPDGELATNAIAAMRGLRDQPFFLALGFAKPHLPFVAPKKYYDLYPLETIGLAPNPFPPRDVPSLALHNSGELRQYPDIPRTGPIPDAQARALRRGYFASVSYVDAQIGRVLAELDRLGLSERTIVVLWGDHGWHLGEHGVWNKHTNFEVATRTPLIFGIPGQKKPGVRTSALAELVDVYPTLCRLAGLPLPEGLEGTDLGPLLDDPARAVKRAAFSQYPRPKAMGYTMRTERHRYTEWRTEAGEVLGAELYDHDTDPQEDVNLAGRAESRALAGELSARLRAGWRAAAAGR
jgi:iduronate 2-sulfatase